VTTRSPAAGTRAFGQEARLAQQAAGAFAEAGVEEPLGLAVALRRRQPVRTLDVVLGTQVLEVDPHRPPRRHARHEGRRRVAAEGFDDDLARLAGGVEGTDLDAGGAAGRHPRQRRRVVDPQPHRVSACGEVARQAPAHAHVAEVVDHAAEDIPAHRRIIEAATIRPR
jgi:hypothetical protein